MSLITNKHFIYVDSHRRVSGSHSNFLYNINLPADQDFDRVVVLNAIIPKSYYLVQTNENTFSLTEGVTTVTVTLPVGCYILGAFSTKVASVLNTASPNGWVYTVTFPAVASNTNTGKFTYAVTGNSSQPSFTFGEHLWEQMGFEKNRTYSFSGSSLVSSNVIKLQVEDRVFINSNIMEGTTENSVLQEVNSASSPDFSSIVYQATCPEYYSKKLVASPSSTYNFNITDEDGRELNMNGLNVNFTLLLYKENDILVRLRDFLKLSLLRQNEEA